MTRSYPWRLALVLTAVVWLANGHVEAQSIGGTVVDPTAELGFHF